MYWIASLALVVFGFLTGFSIGQPFLLVGLTMLVLGPLRGRPLVFWPPLLGVIAYNVVYWAIAPLTCTAASDLGGSASTVCTSLIGLRYGGEGVVNPSLLPAMAAGLLAGVLTALLVFAVLFWRRRARGSISADPSG